MKKGITFGAFDLLHSGHVLMFEEAKSVCDWLIVGLQTDPNKERSQKNKPIQTMFERYLQLKSVKWVDEIIPYDTERDVVNILLTLKPDVRIIGEDYRGRDFTGKGIVQEWYNSRKHDYSTTDLRKKIVS